MKINLNTPFPAFPHGGRGPATGFPPGGRRFPSLPLGGDLEGVFMKILQNY